MKRTVLALVALLAGLVPAKSQTAPGQPASGVANTVQNAGKLTIAHPWEDTMIRLVIPASPQAPGRTENLQAKKAFYQIPPTPVHRKGDLVCVVAGEDPYTGTTFIIEGVDDQGFYVSRTSGVAAFCVRVGGSLLWKQSYLEVTGSSGKLEAAIRKFEAEFDSGKLGEPVALQRPLVQKKDAQGRPYWERVPDANFVDLASAAPRLFFDSPTPGDGVAVFPQIENIEMTNTILRLDIRNPARQKLASFWIDLEARKVVKCVADGKELDITIDRNKYGVPPPGPENQLVFPPVEVSKPAQRGK